LVEDAKNTTVVQALIDNLIAASSTPSYASFPDPSAVSFISAICSVAAIETLSTHKGSFTALRGLLNLASFTK
jgi:hypothetical protein